VERIAQSVGRYQPAEAIDSKPASKGLDGRKMLGSAIINGIDPPKFLFDGELYEAGIHSLIAEGESGKSLLCANYSRLCTDRGLNVLYLDEENHERKQAERLQQMGADPHKLDKHLYYFQSPALPWTND
jgi:hypothetical protein